MQTRRTLITIVILAAGVCFAQFQPRRGPDPRSGNLPGHFIRIEGGLVVNEDEIRTARETDTHSSGTPNWTNTPGFEEDVFTFTRIIFHSEPASRSGGGRGRWLGWWVDYPDADLNLSYRLQQMTSLKVDPDARVLKLTDPELTDYPLLYMEHAGYMELRDEEADALRKYLLNGGALFVNDFWSQPEWDGFEAQMKRVLPGRGWTDLTMDHPIFHSVFELRGPMNRLQVPTMQFWNQDFDPKITDTRDQNSQISRVF